MAHTDPRLPDVFDRPTALRAGMTPRQVERRVAAGRWRVLRRGVYCLAERWDGGDARTRHVLFASAAVLSLAGRHVLSHASGAALHGYPLPFTPGPGWLTTPQGGSTRYWDGLVVMAATLRGDVARHRGIPVTTAARTVADCLRHLGTVDAVAIADAGVRGRPGIWPEVLDVLSRSHGWPYVDRARRRLPLVDGRRESPVESWSYVGFHRQGLPVPEPQVLLKDQYGRVVGRLDGWWEDYAVVGEVDGLTKYGMRSDLTREQAVQALVDEKRREDDIRGTGAHVLRWGTVDLHDEAGWGRWVRGELARGERRRFRGSIVRMPPLTP